MLLFLLCFYFNYDLFNCDETVNAKFNESSIIDKHHRNVLQVNNFLKGHKKLLADIHPSQQHDASDRQDLFHWLPPVFPDFQVPLPPLVIPRPSSPYPMAIFPLNNPGQRPRSPYPGSLIRPMHSLYLSLPPTFLSDYRYQNIYLRPPGPYLPSLIYTPGPTGLKRLPFSYTVNHHLKKNPHLINPLLPTLPDLWVSLQTPPPVSIPSSTIWTSTIGHNAKIWLQEIAPYLPVNENKNSAKDQSAHHHSKKTTVPVTNRMPTTFNDYWFSTGTADTGQLFIEDEHGFLKVTLPEQDGKSVNEPPDTNKNWMSTNAGDVLHGKITTQKLSPTPKQRYLDLMEQLDEGYMMVFMIELCRMTAVKDRREVRDVLHHAEMIYNSLWDNGRLTWIGDPLETVIWKLSIIMSGRDTDLVRTYASMMFHMLLQRRQTLSAEVNSIIDEADLFYNHDEGDRLLYSLKQFEDYPKISTNSYWLCDSLIESFLLPFRRLSGTRRRQRLIDSINKALKQRFPRLLREHNKGTVAGQPRQPRKRKRHHLKHKKKREGKRQRKPEYNNKNVYGRQHRQVNDYKESTLRTLTAVTSVEPTFRVIATESYRTTKYERPTTAFFSLVTRSTRNNKPIYQKTTPFQEKLDSFDKKRHKSMKKTVQLHHYIHRKTSTAGQKPSSSIDTSRGSVILASSGFHPPNPSKRAQKDIISFYQMNKKLKEPGLNKEVKRLTLKTDLLIKITESSSYSDEEESLTKNLNEALKYVNRTVDFVDETR